MLFELLAEKSSLSRVSMELLFLFIAQQFIDLSVTDLGVCK